MKIKTVNDLYMLATRLIIQNRPDTPIALTNRFQEYALDDQWVVEDDNSSTVIIPCEEVGSISQDFARHRVLSKTSAHGDTDGDSIDIIVDSMNSMEDLLDGYSIEEEGDN